jgi:hypothetical protein
MLSEKEQVREALEAEAQEVAQVGGAVGRVFARGSRVETLQAWLPLGPLLTGLNGHSMDWGQIMLMAAWQALWTAAAGWGGVLRSAPAACCSSCCPPSLQLAVEAAEAKEKAKAGVFEVVAMIEESTRMQQKYANAVTGLHEKLSNVPVEEEETVS